MTLLVVVRNFCFFHIKTIIAFSFFERIRGNDSELAVLIETFDGDDITNSSNECQCFSCYHCNISIESNNEFHFVLFQGDNKVLC